MTVLYFTNTGEYIETVPDVISLRLAAGFLC
jgi:hypothetical protein